MNIDGIIYKFTHFLIYTLFVLFSDYDFGETDDLVAEFVAFLCAIDDFALLVFACRKGGNRLVLIGVEIGILRLDGVDVVLVEEGNELLVDEVDAFTQARYIFRLVHGVGRTLKIVNQREHLGEYLLTENASIKLSFSFWVRRR